LIQSRLPIGLFLLGVGGFLLLLLDDCRVVGFRLASDVSLPLSG
jgi:hypothetical protein